ncbi:hypothetical protein Misp06_00502 [Microbulbifer sp. NBRC 101763]|uniref:GNAT family N-acetyltransferase n=1 Tax=unclassified Microbulbifer TaxID=2619833 RepID=UPI0024AD9276|nr:GNAT family N-acetyltransferase [Microbulbifer sp. MLAF003]WHI49724.1 GNAT family N-acetyltransferase [Microbulbifer sp. MLAF003]
MNIRKAEMSDFPRLLELEQCVIDAERPFNSLLKRKSAFYYDIKKLIACPESYLLVAEVDSEIIGTGYAQIRDSKQSLEHKWHSYLGFMYVSPCHRGKGVNAKLINKLIDWSKGRGIIDFYLDVYSENDPAIRAYEKVGFKPSLLEMRLSLDEECT